MKLILPTRPFYNIRVTSRIGARRALRMLNESTIVISIHDPIKPPEFTQEDVRKTPHLCAVLALSFWDELEDENGCMSYAQAAEVLQFVKNYQPWVKNILVHCEAGISRSAGVAAAISKILNGNDDYFFDYFHNRYVPNMTCYKRILETYFEKE